MDRLIESWPDRPRIFTAVSDPYWRNVVYQAAPHDLWVRVCTRSTSIPGNTLELTRLLDALLEGDEPWTN